MSQYKFRVDLNSKLIDDHQLRLTKIPLAKRQLLKLDPNCLIWTPYVSYHLMVAATAAEKFIEYVDTEIQCDGVEEDESPGANDNGKFF